MSIAPGRYIVRLQDDVDVDGFLDEHDIDVRERYHIVFHGFSAAMSEEAAEGLKSDDRVYRIEPDKQIEFLHDPIDQRTPGWVLEALYTGEAPGELNYRYARDGAGVRVYVVDAGVEFDHFEFAGRNFEYDPNALTTVPPGRDVQAGDGHGTRVASIIGGRTAGVAKRCTLISVYTAGLSGSIVGRFEWILANHPGGPGVVNLSMFFPGGSQSVDDATMALINAGISVVAAAGNDNVVLDSNWGSPQRIPEVVCVGSLGGPGTSVSSLFSKASTSNFGSLVDVWVPTNLGRAASKVAFDAYVGNSMGTSYSSPVVAGVVALILGDEPTLTPAQVHQRLIDMSVSGKVNGLPTGSHDRLLVTTSLDSGDIHSLQSPTVSATALPPVANTLSINNMAHGHALATVDIAQVHALQVAPMQHQHLVDAVTISQVHALAVQAMIHPHILESPALAQAHALAIQNMQHAHALDAVAITQVHALVVQAMMHAHVLESPALSQVHVLAIQGMQHDHALDAVALSQAHALDIAPLTHPHTLEALSLSQVHILNIAALQHAHIMEPAVLSEMGALGIQDIYHPHVMDSLSLAQAHVLIINEVIHNHVLDNVVLTVPFAWTFTRDSIAYLNGVLHQQHVQRIRRGGLLIEEGTSNAMSLNKSNGGEDGTTLLIAHGVGGVISVDSTISYSGARSHKGVFDGSVAQQGVSEHVGALVAEGATFSVSFQIRPDPADVGKSVRLRQWGGGYTPQHTHVLQAGWQRITWSGPRQAGTQAGIVISPGQNVPMTFWIDEFQIEAKPYATSWQPGGTPRAAERIIVPHGGISPSEGTIEVDVDLETYNIPTANRIFHVQSSVSAQGLLVYRDEGFWRLYAQHDDGTTTTRPVEISEVSAGQTHRFAVAWDASGIQFYVDGVARSSAIPLSFMPSAFSGASLGSRSLDNLHFLNNPIKGARFSSRRRTAGELAQWWEPLEVDEDTTWRAVWGFQSALDISHMAHVHVLDPANLMQAHFLSVADLQHAHEIEHVGINQVHILIVDDMTHLHEIDNIEVTGEDTLIVLDLSHAHEMDEITLEEILTLLVEDLWHDHEISNVTLFEDYLFIHDMRHQHVLEDAELTEEYTLGINPLVHGHTMDAVTLTEVYSLTIDNLVHFHTMDAVEIGQISTLVIADLTHAHTLEHTYLIPIFVGVLNMVVYVSREGLLEFSTKPAELVYTTTPEDLFFDSEIPELTFTTTEAPLEFITKPTTLFWRSQDLEK